MFDIAVGTVGSTLSRFSGGWYLSNQEHVQCLSPASRIAMLRRCIILFSTVPICYGVHPSNGLIHD